MAEGVKLGVRISSKMAERVAKIESMSGLDRGDIVRCALDDYINKFNLRWLTELREMKAIENINASIEVNKNQTTNSKDKMSGLVNKNTKKKKLARKK